MIATSKPLALPDEGNSATPPQRVWGGIGRFLWIAAVAAVLVFGASAASVVATATAASAPTISGFTPASGSAGAVVTISGTGFTGATAVAFNGSSASYSVNSDGQITATVPTGATSGPITVTTPAGQASSGASSPVSYINAGVARATSGATSLALALPTGYQAGDLLIAWLSFADNAQSVTGMTGWTEFPWSPLDDGTSWHVRCFYKIAAASDAAPTIRWTNNSKAVFETAAWRGVSQTSPILASAGALDLLRSNNVIGPTATTTLANEWAVALFTLRTSNSTDKNTSFSGFTPTGLSKRADANLSTSAYASWVGAAIADSSGGVTAGNHQYTGLTTATQGSSHKAGALIYLTPAVTNSGSFTLTSAPTISGFTPTGGPAGTTVTINGSGFTGASAVAFNGTSATYTVTSNSQISATVPSSANSGPITVTTPAGSTTSSGSFTLTSAPTISGFTPTGGPAGTTVTINGSGFTGASAVAFNGTSATYTVTSNSQISATVPSSANSGPITVTTPAGSTTSSGSFTLTSAPTISGFTPTGGPAGTTVTINGSGFTGASAVAFNGTSATYTVTSNSQISATVPSSANSGPITVTTPAGSTTSSGSFTLTSAPTISGFTPTGGPAGTTVTINGSGFTGASAVAFNGTSATYTVTSNSQISATVPSSANSGPITVTTPAGSTTSSGSFTLTSAPTISGFTPTGGPAGTTVTINGSGFTGASAVAFNGTSATYTVTSNSQISATVPSSANSGPITVTTPAGSTTSSGSFTLTSAPTISGFTPTGGPAGTTVTINGSGFTGASAVAFNGTSATYTVTSNSQISATVPSSANSGPITVTTPAGSTTSSGSFTLTSATYRVYVGYYDTHHPNNPQPKPNPWMLSPNVLFVGTNDEGNNTILGNWDSSAVRIDNLTGAPLANVHVTVDIPVVYPTSNSSHHFDLWGTWTIPAGQSLILTQTAFENFDGSDYNSKAGQYGQDPALCTNPNDISTGIPTVHVTIGTTTTDFSDTNQILNTHGVDSAGCLPPVASPTRNDESANWQQLG